MDPYRNCNGHKHGTGNESDPVSLSSSSSSSNGQMNPIPVQNPDPQNLQQQNPHPLQNAAIQFDPNAPQPAQNPLYEMQPVPPMPIPQTSHRRDPRFQPLPPLPMQQPMQGYPYSIPQGFQTMPDFPCYQQPQPMPPPAREIQPLLEPWQEPIYGSIQNPSQPLGPLQPLPASAPHLQPRPPSYLLPGATHQAAAAPDPSWHAAQGQPHPHVSGPVPHNYSLAQLGKGSEDNPISLSSGSTHRGTYSDPIPISSDSSSGGKGAAGGYPPSYCRPEDKGPPPPPPGASGGGINVNRLETAVHKHGMGGFLCECGATYSKDNFHIHQRNQQARAIEREKASSSKEAEDKPINFGHGMKGIRCRCGIAFDRDNFRLHMETVRGNSKIAHDRDAVVARARAEANLQNGAAANQQGGAAARNPETDLFPCVYKCGSVCLGMNQYMEHLQRCGVWMTLDVFKPMPDVHPPTCKCNICVKRPDGF